MRNDAGVTAKSNHCWDEAPFVLSSARSCIARRREELIPAKQKPDLVSVRGKEIKRNRDVLPYNAENCSLEREPMELAAEHKPNP